MWLRYAQQKENEATVSYATIVVSNDGPMRTIMLNRPERRNAMTPAMQQELIAAMGEAEADGSRMLVLRGAGEAFCAGLDLSVLRAMQDKSVLEYREDARLTARLFRALYELPIPTIALVHGAAIAGGAGLAMMCDFTLATPSARFGLTEVRIGFVPAIISVFLSLQLSEKRLRDLALTGRVMDAVEAQRLGLVTEVVAAQDLEPRLRSLSDLLLAASPQAQRATKQLMTAQRRAWLNTAIEEAIHASVAARDTEDFREGVAAFLEKSKPNWQR